MTLIMCCTSTGRCGCRATRFRTTERRAGCLTRPKKPMFLLERGLIFLVGGGGYGVIDLRSSHRICLPMAARIGQKWRLEMSNGPVLTAGDALPGNEPVHLGAVSLAFRQQPPILFADT